MCEVKGAHIKGKQPDILEDFGGECVYLHCCLADVPAPTCSPPRAHVREVEPDLYKKTCCPL